MFRLLITILIPLVAPTAIYFLYAWYKRRRAGASPAVPRSEIPWVWLGVISGALVLVTIITGVLFWPTELGIEYIPKDF